MMSNAATLETIEVILPSDSLIKIRAEAARSGANADAIIAEAVEEKVARMARRPPTQKSIDEILAPLHEYVRNSGETEEELEAFIDSELAAFRREVNGK